jgi:hypothetical protein
MGHPKDVHPGGKMGKDNEELMDTVRSKQEALLARLQELRAASSDAWGELKTGAENALDELKGSVQKVIGRFEEALKKGTTKD